MRAGTFKSDLLLGAKHLSRRERIELGSYFADVAEQRGFPLHTAVLWNLLYFGWDLDRDGYLGMSPHIMQATSGKPIPVGAFVDVPPEETPIYGEVVYKEQRDPSVDLEAGGLVDAELSGRRAALPATGHSIEVPEMLVLDYDAFGSDFHEYGDVEFERFVRKGRIDENLHRCVTATYHPDEPTDDLSVFVRYVLDTYGEDLFAEFSVGLSAFTDSDRHDLLLTSLTALDEIAGESERLMTFGDYHVSRRNFERTRARSDEDVLSGRLFESMVGRVADIPARSNRAHTAAGLMLHDLARQSSEGARVLRGTYYARVVGHLNAAISRLAGTNDDVHVRLDDDGIFGGVWRAERLNGRKPGHTAIDPLVPLGLGYAESAGRKAEFQAPQPSTPILEVEEANWTVTLRQIDLDHGDLPLPERAVSMLVSGVATTMLDLGIEGETETRKSYELDRDRRLVRGIRYPIDFSPGTKLHCSIAWAGKSVRARAHRLAVPVEVEGMTLRFEFDDAVFRRELRLAPLPAKAFRGSRSLADRITTVFRQRGRPTDDGGWALRAEEVIHGIYGQDVAPEEAGSILLALGGMDLEFADGEHIWRPRLSRRTSARERSRIRAARSTEAGKRLARRIQTRLVPMHLRHLKQRRPGVEKQRTYEAALRQNKAFGRLPAKLPPGATWVRPFRIGREGEAIEAVIEA